MDSGIVHATFVDVKEECLSPETSEFVNLERQIMDQNQPNFILGNHSRKSSEIQREMEAEEQSRLQLQSELEEKLEERKRSMELSSTENGLQLMERRQFRQFSRADEYLYAMKEDLAEWMNNLYPHIDMDADNFMTRLETGEHLVQVRQDFLFPILEGLAFLWDLQEEDLLILYWNFSVRHSKIQWVKGLSLVQEFKVDSLSNVFLEDKCIH